MTSMEFCGVSAGQDCGQGTLGTWGVTGPAVHPRHTCGVCSIGAVSAATLCLLCLAETSAEDVRRQFTFPKVTRSTGLEAPCPESTSASHRGTALAGMESLAGDGSAPHFPDWAGCCSGTPTSAGLTTYISSSALHSPARALLCGAKLQPPQQAATAPEDGEARDRQGQRSRIH